MINITDRLETGLSKYKHKTRVLGTNQSNFDSRNIVIIPRRSKPSKPANKMRSKSSVFTRLSRAGDRREQRAIQLKRDREEAEMEECTFKPKINRTQPLGRRNGLQNVSGDTGHYRKKGKVGDVRTGESEDLGEGGMSHSKRVRRYYEQQSGGKGRGREKRKGRSRSRSKSKSKTRKNSRLQEKAGPGDRLFREAEKRENRRMQRQREKRQREDNEIKQNLQKGRRLSKSKHQCE